MTAEHADKCIEILNDNKIKNNNIMQKPSENTNKQTVGRKEIPYGLYNFGDIRRGNYLYVDKTRFIEMLDKAGTKHHFLTRPKKFGKTLFLSVMEHYFDIRFKDEFEELFGDLYIGKNPTANVNRYFVMNFDFSGINTRDTVSFNYSFLNAIKSSIVEFFRLHETIIGKIDTLKTELNQLNDVRACVEFALDVVHSFGKRAYVIVDEYDHFANDIIAKGTVMSEVQFNEAVWANSITKDFYETLKRGAKYVIDKIFITGVTPIMLDDVTSGFNIADNVSLQLRYNEILGLTRDEVEWVMEEIQLDKSLITIDLEQMYDGYVFNEDATNKLFNPTMIFNYFQGLMVFGKKFKEIVDENLKTDYGRIENLFSKQKNKEKIRELIENNSVSGFVVKTFRMKFIHDDENFYSLLFYMGLVTIDNSDPTRYALKIPNISVKTMYWDYIKQILTKEVEGLSLDIKMYMDVIRSLAYDNEYKSFFEYFSKNVVSYLSNRDLQNTVEKDMKFLLLPMFINSNFYFTYSEIENSSGYSDVYLQRNHLHPNAISEWVFELKYVKQSEANDQKIIDAKKNEAITQLRSYKSSNMFKNRTDVRYLAVVFVGKTDYFVEEVL